MKLLLRAKFDRYSGYGNDGVDLAIWLSRAGHDVHLLPITLLPGLPQEFTDLLTKTSPRYDYAYDAAIQFAPPYMIRVSDKSIKGVKPGLPERIALKHYGISMWEMMPLRREDMRGKHVGQRPWRLLDRMYVPNKMNVDAFRAYDPDVKYRVLPFGVDPEVTAHPSKRSVKGPTKFCMIGELSNRKNPWAAIEALRKVRAEGYDVELFLKTTTPGLHPALEEKIEGLRIINEKWPYPQLIEWMKNMHVYLGPSRGEGVFKPPMEFALTGGAVAVTTFGGPKTWFHPAIGWAIDYDLVPVSPGHESLWADANPDHIAQIMMHCHDNREEVAEKGMQAAEWIRKTATWERTISQLTRDIEEDLR